MSEEARTFASDRGAAIMIYPPVILGRPEGFHNVWPERQLLECTNQGLIAGLKQVFGAWRWPSNG